MNDSSSITLESLKTMTDFLSTNSILIATIILLIAYRVPISGLISRLTSFSLKKGDSELGIEAAHPKWPDEKTANLPNAAEKPAIDNQETEINEKTKEESWSSEMYKAFEEGRIEDAETAFKKYAIDEKDKSSLEKSKALYLYLRFKMGKDSSAINDLNELAQSATTEDGKLNSLSWLSLYLRDNLQHKKDIDIWRAAAKEFKSKELLIKVMINLAHALERDNKSHEAKNILIEQLSTANNDKQRSSIYLALSDIEESLGNKDISIYCKDKSLEYDPNDTDELFNSAYAASNEGISEISISNYLRLVRIDPENSTALNNLGVCTKEEGLNIKAAESYNRAIELGNTLAMSNQGFMLLEAGFAEEAEEIAKKALKLDNPHENIYSLITEINRKKEEQTSKWEKIIEKTQNRQKQIRYYIDQYYLGNPESLAGPWATKDLSPTTATIKNNMLEASWIEPAGAWDKHTYTSRLRGNVSGSTFSGTFTKKRNEESPSTLLGLPRNTNINCIGYISEEGEKLNILSSRLKDDFSLILSRPVV